ncbi:MAG: proline--tRNA ligase, partial [Pedobacter sp.]
NFAKAFDVKFTNKEGKIEHVWATSWGVSTRLMGALIMAHSDDAGLVLPPKLAPIQVVIVPIYKSDEELQKISAFVDELKPKLKGLGISVKYDDRDTQRPGFKFAEYELKGVPVRLAIGGRDMENGTVELARRDTREKQTVPQEGLDIYIAQLLEEIQANIYNKAHSFREDHITQANSYDEFKELLDGKTGFISAHWDGTPETEQKIKEETKATIRCVPLDNPLEDGVCIYSGKPSTQRVLFARAY